MSSKAKHAAGPATGITLYQQGLRHLQKRDFKQALKDARVCYRQASTPEHRLFLEQAAIARAKELQQGGLTPQAIDILQELLALPLQDIAVRNATPELLHKLGILERYPQYRASLEANPELQSKLTRQAVDNCVVQSQELQSVPHDVRETAARVRQAWEFVTAGSETEGLELLQDIPRLSPFADWRLFIRGLAAFYRNDAESQTANWGRLAAQRIPSRLAKLLIVWREPRRADGLDPRLSLDGLERAVWGAPLCGDLETFKSHVHNGNWESAVVVLGRLRPHLRQHAPETLQSLSRIVREHIILKGDGDLLVLFKRHAEPPVFDPHWHQVEALLRESYENQHGGPETRAEFEEVNTLWKKFSEDLEAIPTLSVEDRRLGRALIWNHLGERYDAMLNAESDPDEDEDEDESESERLEDDEQLSAMLLSCFRKSLAERPDLLQTHVARCEYFENRSRSDELRAAQLDLLQYHPDDVATLQDVSADHLLQHQYALALPFVERLLKLKPLDPGVLRLARIALSELAREAAGKKQWDAGREYFDRIDRDCEGRTRYFMQVRRGMLESVAGNTEQAASRFAAVLKIIPPPAVLALLQSIEGVRYRLPKAQCTVYQQQWAALLKEKFDPPAAVEMCRAVLDYVIQKIAYTGRAGHVKLLVAYLKRGAKSTFEAEGLQAICGFLKELGGQKTLLRTFAMRGKSLHPTVPQFDLALAQMEFEKGPRRADTWVIEKHAKLVLKHADPRKDQHLIDTAQELLDEISMGFNSILGGLGGFFDRFNDSDDDDFV